MERKRNYIGKVRDWADDRLRRMCGRITPGKRLAVILVMFFFLGGLSIYITVSSIYNIGKRDGRRLQIRTHQATAVARQRHNQKYQPLKQTAIWKKYRRMRTARPYRRRTGSRKRKINPNGNITPQQVQQRRKMIVFPLMFLAFAGCMYLIFAPSGKEDVNVESVGGFNADIPLPAEDGIIADKQKAYEQAMISRRQQEKIQSLQDFGFTGNDEAEEPQAEIDLMPEEDAKPQRGGGASSAYAYRDINRQLSTFYETPAVDEEKEDLKRQVAELTDRLQQQNATPTADDQMALLEKSYELAAKYMNGGQGQVAQVPVTGDIDRKPDAVAVQAVRETTVSGLRQPMSDADFIRLTASHETTASTRQ